MSAVLVPADEVVGVLAKDGCILGAEPGAATVVVVPSVGRVSTPKSICLPNCSVGFHSSLDILKLWVLVAFVSTSTSVNMGT